MIDTDFTAKRRTWQKAIPYLLLSALVIYVAVRSLVHAAHHHFLLESDSVAYLELGTHLWKGKGFVDYTGQWCSDWPPLYALALGLAERLSHSALLSFGIVSTISLIATIIVAFLWICKLSDNVLLRCIITAAIAVCYPVTNLANSGLSESLFIPLALAALLSICVFAEQGKQRCLVISALLGLLCCLTRYIGLTVIASSLLALFLSSSKPDLKKVRDSLLYLSIAVVPFFGWCLINKLATNSWMGERDRGDHTFQQCWTALISCLQYAFAYRALFFIFLVIIGSGIVYAACRNALFRTPYVYTSVVFTLLYTSLLLWSSTTYSIDMVDDRLTAPIFPTLIISSVGLFEYTRTQFTLPMQKRVSEGFALLFISLIYGTCQLPQVPDGGYLTSEWYSSPTLAFVRRANLDAPLFSNDSSAAYLLANKTASGIADGTDSPTMSYVESEFDNVPNKSYIIWLYDGLQPENFAPGTIVSNCPVTVVAKFDDGVIFRRKGSGQLTASSL